MKAKPLPPATSVLFDAFDILTLLPPLAAFGLFVAAALILTAAIL